jgi:hypothetical protein
MEPSIIKNLTEKEFDEQFVLEKNHIDNNAGFDGCMFETYGEELDYVFKMSKKNRVVTIIEGDGEDECEEIFINNDGVEVKDVFPIPNLYYISGFHYVNRLGFFVLDRPYEYEFEVKVD